MLFNLDYFTYCERCGKLHFFSIEENKELKQYKCKNCKVEQPVEHLNAFDWYEIPKVFFHTSWLKMITIILIGIFTVIYISTEYEKRVDKIYEDVNKKQLFITATPSDSRIMIMNIKEKYSPGIRLSPGMYTIKVLKKGYKSTTITIDMDKYDLNKHIILNK